ncbi:MAG TPA: caspase family protein [Acidimicrobiales bacterium]|nr:caspase family protein [Acidimicrobiales bacterium]
MRRAVLLLALLVAGVLASTVPASAAAPPAAAERWALIVGVDRFQGATRPNYGAVADAADVREALLKAGWADDHIRVLTDGGATARDIRAGLQWLVDRSGPKSLSVFHYSGHVKQVGSTESLWPYDNSFIADTDLATQLRQLKGQAWVDISGCEAAGFDEGISAPNRLFTASSRANEKSYEIPDMRQSVFTLLQVEQAMIKGAGDANRDGKVSVQEAFDYAAVRAPQITAGQKQGAQHPVMAGWDGTPLFLDAVASAPAAPAAAKKCFLFLCS